MAMDCAREELEGASCAVVREEWGEGSEQGERGFTLSLRGRGADVPRCMAECEDDEEWLYCERYAGQGTVHRGAGRCARHGGNTAAGRKEGARIMGHAFARHLGVTPWEALLTEVQRSAGALAYLDDEIARADVSDPSALLSGDMGELVKMRERMQAHMVRASKACLDAGVAQIIADRAQAEGEKIARVLAAGMDSLELDEGQRVRVLQAMEREMKALGASESEESAHLRRAAGL